MSEKIVRGYKVFNPDWKCRDFQYEVGKTYTHEGKFGLCDGGFHFCKVMADCFDYYDFNPKNKIAEIEAIGKVESGSDKSVTDEIRIVREISWEEMLTIANQGKGNSGISNSGNRNSGYSNSGNRNSGYRNSGYRNSGDSNSGDWNLSDNNSGCFNTEEHKLLFFDKESDLTYGEWLEHAGHDVLNRFSYTPTEWICDDDMTDEEKAEHPEYKTTQGYLKQNYQTQEQAFQEFWNKLNVESKAAVLTIPNFDAVKFEKITGVNVHEGDLK